MGITVHFEGRLKESDSFDRCVRILTKYIDKNSWDYSEIVEKEKEKNPALKGPVRLKSGRIVDLIS